ncbi:internal head protein [Erwinia phage AH06]|nr:internal head protein [Erwinia phage AH06]
MSISAFLNLGAEAFEDAPVQEPAPSVVVAPVSEEVIELIADRDDADLAVEMANDVADMSAGARQVEEYAAAIERVENVQASMEHFIECGLSQKSAMMLHRQISTVMASIGKDGSAIGGGLENFDNEEASIALLSSGLEALNSEKASLGERIRAAMINGGDGINKFFSKFLTAAGRMKSRAEAISKAAKAKGTASAEVKLKSKYLTVKGGAASTNLAADIAAFHKFAEDGAARFFKDGGSFLSGAVLTAIKSMGAATTMEQASKIVNGLKYPGYPGATITVQDKPAFTIKRTEVVLGGYAVFDLQYKTTGGETQPELVHELKALGKNRVHVKQAPEEKGKSEFDMTVSAADAAAIADEVIKLAGIAQTLQRNIAWMDPFTKSLINSSVAAEAANTRAANSEKGVAVVLDALARVPTGVFQSVQSLSWELSSAILKVGDAGLKVANKVAKSSESRVATGDEVTA